MGKEARDKQKETRQQTKSGHQPEALEENRAQRVTC